jgi:hypothetical protein
MTSTMGFKLKVCFIFNIFVSEIDQKEIISHKGRKSKWRNTEDSEYFTHEEQISKNLLNTESKLIIYKIHNFMNILTVVYLVPTKMNLLTPKFLEMKDTVIKNRYNNPQQSRDAMKYIAIYRKSLRNNNNLSSSRTKIQHGKFIF